MAYRRGSIATLFSATFRANDVANHDASTLFNSHLESNTPSRIVDTVQLVNEHVSRFVSDDDEAVEGFNEVTVVIPHGESLNLLATPSKERKGESSHRAIYQ